jgi:hydroxyethylthiazole kinase-like uncharacterized protein yjeF
MKRLLTSAQMRETDRRAIEEVGIPGLILMENAGLGVARLVTSILDHDTSKRILILCGKGNNGGDGFVAARHLINRGYPVEVCLAPGCRFPSSRFSARPNSINFPNPICSWTRFSARA